MWKLKTTIAFLITFLLCGLIGFFTVQNRISAEREQLEKLILEHSYRLNEVLSQQLYRTQALAAFVINGDGTVEDFQKIATVMASDVPALAAFLLAPGGVVIDAYPIEDNPTVVGLNFLDEDDHAGNREAIIARDTGELVMGGPFILRSGIMGITGRYPVYTYNDEGESEFWGLVAVSLKFPEALEDARLNMLEHQGLFYEIWRVDPDINERQIIATSNSSNVAGTQYIERQVYIHHAQWYFRIYMTDSWYDYPETWISVLGALAISFFIAFVIQARSAAISRAARFREATEAKSKFLALISHEIRTPMNAIIGISEVELENAHTPDVHNAFDKITNSSRMLLRIINDLLDLSKVETGKLPIVPIDYDVPGMIYDAARLNCVLIGDKPVEFVLKASETLPSVLNGDDRRIKQILNNILSNAIKYTNEGKVTLAVDSQVSETEVSLIFTIEDSGQGLTKEQLSTLYDEYSMFNKKTNREIEGTGLGMSITKKFVEQMSGRIEVESEPGVGTTFTVSIPQKAKDDSTIGKDVAESLSNFMITTGSIKAKPIRKNMFPGSILIVDDLAENLFITEELMRRYGLRTDTAASGYEALEKVSDGNVYDIIFMDYMMPEMDGVETLKKLRQQGYKHPIVALTANAVAGMKEFYLESGFNDFLPKPFEKAKLESVLKEFIGDKKEQSSSLISALGKVDGIDVASALGSYGGLEDVYIDTVRITARMLPERIERIDRLKSDDIESFTIEVHGLKSVLTNLGANTLSISAAQLERAAMDLDESYINEKSPEFLTELEKLSVHLNEILQINSANMKKTGDKFLLAEIIPELKAAVESFDSILALEILSPYTDFSFDKETDELLEKIIFSLETSDYESAIAGIDEMEGK